MYTNDTADLAGLAATFSAALVPCTRTDGSTFYSLADDAPHRDAFLDMIRREHGDLPPDDMCYSTIRKCARALAERGNADEWDDATGEIADGLVDSCNVSLAQWLASAPAYRAWYVDLATREFGAVGTLFEALGRGQYLEYQYILECMICGLRDLAKSLDDEATETDDRA